MHLTVETLQTWHGDGQYHLPEGRRIEDSVCATGEPQMILLRRLKWC